jgi:nicotinamide-nucleotide amidase
MRRTRTARRKSASSAKCSACSCFSPRRSWALIEETAASLRRWRVETGKNWNAAVTAALADELSLLSDEAVQRLLTKACDAQLRLAAAESCTGGLLASILTDVVGCSHAFDRGFVVYTDAAKHAMLGIDPALIEVRGAVSREVALAMAEGALAHSEADIAVSITGFAGPAGDDDEEGLVHVACARRGRETRHREAHFGKAGRARIRAQSLCVALSMIEEMLA